MERAIDLLILSPHCSHILQPLDVSVFSPLKRTLAAETDAVTRLDAGRVSRVDWTLPGKGESVYRCEHQERMSKHRAGALKSDRGARQAPSGSGYHTFTASYTRRRSKSRSHSAK